MIPTNAREYFNELIGDIPEDITLMTPDDLRNAHAYWTGSHNYSSSILSGIQSKIKELKRRREVKFKTTYLENKNKRMSNEAARYASEMSKKVSALDDKINFLEVNEIKWESLLKQCDYLKALCSRDQSYREEELKTYYGRGGTGR